MKKFVAPLIGLALMATLAFVWLAPSGAAAPEFQLRSIDGQPIHSQQLLGKPALITFWATSCVSCVAEQPHLNELHDKYAKQGLNIIAIAMDFDPIEHITAMRAERQLRYTVAHDSTGQVAKDFGDIRLTPTNILLSPEGRIVFQKLGEIDFKRLEQQIAGLL